MTPSKIIISNSASEVRHRRIIMRADGFYVDYVSTKIIVKYILETGSPIIPLNFLSTILKDESVADARGLFLPAMKAMRSIHLSKRTSIMGKLQKFSCSFQKLTQENQQ